MSHNSRLPNPAAILSTGTLLLLVTILLGWIIAPKFIHDKIADKVKLTRDSEVWDKWENVPIPVYFKIYLFNVSNPEDILKGGYPDLKEIGPFVYRELREKTDIKETDNGTILYKEKITYFFQPEMSNGLSELDELTILNVPYVAMSQKVSELLFPLNQIGLTYIKSYKEKAFVTKSVQDILFKGWKVPIVAGLEENLGLELMPNSTFGLFYGKNATDDGYLEVDAGLSNIEDFGRIRSWRGHRKLSWWTKDSHCNELKGSDGSIFSPFVTKERILRIFNADLCSSLYLTYEQDIKFRGIPAYRFTAPVEMLEDPRTSEYNSCYCEEEDDDCLHDGAINLASCRDGAPVAISTPHFLDGYAEYSSKSGLIPDREKHSTILDIEPNTGIVLRAHKRIQINVLMKPVKSIPSISKLPNMLFPVVWADETAEIDEELALDLKSKLLTPLATLCITKWISLAASIILIVSAIILWGLRGRRAQTKIIYEDSESSTTMLKKNSNEAVIVNTNPEKSEKSNNLM